MNVYCSLGDWEDCEVSFIPIVGEVSAETQSRIAQASSLTSLCDEEKHPKDLRLERYVSVERDLMAPMDKTGCFQIMMSWRTEPTGRITCNCDLEEYCCPLTFTYIPRDLNFKQITLVKTSSCYIEGIVLCRSICLDDGWKAPFLKWLAPFAESCGEKVSYWKEFLASYTRLHPFSGLRIKSKGSDVCGICRKSYTGEHLCVWTIMNPDREHMTRNRNQNLCPEGCWCWYIGASRPYMTAAYYAYIRGMEKEPPVLDIKKRRLSHSDVRTSKEAKLVPVKKVQPTTGQRRRERASEHP